MTFCWECAHPYNWHRVFGNRYGAMQGRPDKTDILRCLECRCDMFVGYSP